MAKAAARKVLYEAGYERDMFDVYDTKLSEFEHDHVNDTLGLMVHAGVSDGTILEVRLLTTRNELNLAAEPGCQRITRDLYHVLQTTVDYRKGDESVQSYNIEGTFKGYKEACVFAQSVLLSEVDGLTRESYAQYDETGTGQADCGYGENVLVHAIGYNGENSLVIVVKEQAMDSVRLAEAAMRMR